MFTKSLALLLALVLPGVASADSVVDMCSDSGREASVCHCAAERLLLEVGAEDYSLYERVGISYRDNLGSGMSTGEAWDAAVKDQATDTSGGFVNSLQTTNQVGKAHRKAMDSCAP